MKTKYLKNLVGVFLVTFFVLSVACLFWSANRSFEGEWFAIHFEKFKSDDLNFVFKNNSLEKDFRYEVWQEEEKIMSNNFRCLEKECLVEISEKNWEGKVVVKVFSEKEEREIYKNF